MQGVFSSDDPNTYAVEATGTNHADAIHATSDRTGVYAFGSTFGVWSASNNGIGILGSSTSGVGLYGWSQSDIGVFGHSEIHGAGVVGEASNAGVMAFNSNNDNAAYLASACCAAWFTGGVHITGNLSKGGGGFRIDHPLDPAHKFLAHSFVESPDMKNVYDGVVTTDANGEATVILPDYFGAVNREFRYQLTPIGRPAPELHIAREIGSNQFTIAGAKPGMRVSWQVTGIRHDAWAEANRIEVEPKKPETEDGFYLHPELHGHGPEKSIGHLLHPHPAQRGPMRSPAMRPNRSERAR